MITNIFIEALESVHDTRKLLKTNPYKKKHLKNHIVSGNLKNLHPAQTLLNWWIQTRDLKVAVFKISMFN
jgi:hypothetical protein